MAEDNPKIHEGGRFCKGNHVGRPFPKGVSGNPNGRPKGDVCLTTLIKRKLKEMATVTDKSGQKRLIKYGDLMAESLIQNAIKGNGTAIKEILARIDGPIPTELTGADGAPLFPNKPDLSGYTTEELKQLQAIHESAESRRDNGGTGEA